MEPNKHTALQLHAAGKSYSEIAVELDISKTTAFAWVKEARMNRGAFRPSPSSTSDRIGRMNPRVKEPAHYTQQRQRIDELTSLTEQMSQEIRSIREKQIERERLRITRQINRILELDGETWTVDDLYETESELSDARDELLAVDPNQVDWLDEVLEPVCDALLEAAEQLEEEGLDEGQVWLTD